MLRRGCALQYLENQMAVALGGRIAEELIFGEDDITTGAGGDFQQVTRTARMMVEQMGFSDKLGQVAWGGGGGPSFLGASAGTSSDFSQTTADIIDTEVRAPRHALNTNHLNPADCMLWIGVAPGTHVTTAPLGIESVAMSCNRLIAH